MPDPPSWASGDLLDAPPIDLLLQPGAVAGELQLFLTAPGTQQGFTTAIPAQLQQAYDAWRHRFLAFHTRAAGATATQDSARRGAAPSSDALRHYESQLLARLQDWLQSPAWFPLQQCLAQQVDAPLRLRFTGLPPWVERLPWDVLPLQRPIWRVAEVPSSSTPGASGSPRRLQRQPRLLLLIGDERGLSLDAELQALTRLERQGRIRLSVLRSQACSLEAIRAHLAAAEGWDGLVFLGHSEADSAAGGRLHLGDGSWLTAQMLEDDLRLAASRGLALLLLSSCSGLDLARSAVICGIPWAVCFREPVPCAAAAQAFCALLDGLVDGRDLPTALGEARRAMERSGPAGPRVLLSLMASPVALPLQLPLRKRRMVSMRLASSSRAQAIAAAAFTLVALVAEVVPWNPISQTLLDQRVRLQREWRLLSGQAGPSRPALPLLLLEPRRAYPALGVPISPDRQHLSRLALLRVLERTSPQAVPRLGLDVVLDDPALEPATTAALAAEIRRQGRAEVFAGYYGPNSVGPGAGLLSRPLPVLQDAGLKSYDLGVGTPPCAALGPCRRPLPLQLREPVDAHSFAQALAANRQRYLPADAVIDWSLPWHGLIHPVAASELAFFRAPVLLVGSDGQADPSNPDLFEPPAAMQPVLEAWGLPTTSLPGVVLQAVLAQSLNLNHWLRPASLTACTAVSSGLGVLLAAAQARRRRRLQLLALIAIGATAVSVQAAVSAAVLIPLLLPLSALGTITLLRRD